MAGAECISRSRTSAIADWHHRSAQPAQRTVPAEISESGPCPGPPASLRLRDGESARRGSCAIKCRIEPPLPFLRLTLQLLPVSQALDRINGPSAIRLQPQPRFVTTFRRAKTLVPGQRGQLNRARLCCQFRESPANHYLNRCSAGVNPERPSITDRFQASA